MRKRVFITASLLLLTVAEAAAAESIESSAETDGYVARTSVCAIQATDGMGADRTHFSKEDSLTICNMLEEARLQPQAAGQPLFFARKFIGRPYVAHTLELPGEERLVVNMAQLDCTTLVETVTALTMCAARRLYSFRDYLNALMSLRYRGGRLEGYVSRLHYFSDWIEDKGRMGITTEIQSPTPPFTGVQKLDIYYMSTHAKSYKALDEHPEFIEEIREQEKELTGKTYSFIPKRDVRNTKLMRETVKDGDIIAITCNKKGLDIAHLGFAVWRDDGLHLLNASMLHKKVVEEPMTLYKYLQQHPSHTGIRIVRLNRMP